MKYKYESSMNFYWVGSDLFFSIFGTKGISVMKTVMFKAIQSQWSQSFRAN